MIVIAYEEVFRLLFFTFLLHYSRMNNVTSTSTQNELLVIDLSQKFNEYIELKARTCTDERWLLLIYFYKLVSLFKSYEKAMRAGDSVSMEAVENVFCGVFLLLDKSNYVEIILSQIEKKYRYSTFQQLQEIRINSCARYKKDSKNDNTMYTMHVLDEMMENVNMWVKSLPLGDDKESRVLHSPNVTLARKCHLFEKIEYRRGLINFEKLVKEGVTVERDHKHSEYVCPKKQIEKQRVFEFLTVYFGEEINNRLSDPDIMYSSTTKLKTKLNPPQKSKENSQLIDHDLDLIFDDINNINTNNESSIGQDDDNSDICSSDDEESNIGKTSVTIKHHKFAMKDIVVLGMKEMVSKDYAHSRVKKMERHSRNELFISELFQNLTKPNNENEEGILWLVDPITISMKRNKPSFTLMFNNIVAKNT